MKIKVYIGILLAGLTIVGCTNLRPAGDTSDGDTTPPPVTWSTLNVTVRLAGAGWDISDYTNIGLVLVPMTNSNALAGIDVKYDWSNQIVYLNPSTSFTHIFTNISKNLAPSGGGKYGLFIFKDTNMDGVPTPSAIGFTEPQPDGSTNIPIDGASAYNVTFQKIRATFNITMPTTNDGKVYYLFTDDSIILIDSYPSILLSVPFTPGTVPSGSGLAFQHVLTFDYATNLYAACYIDVTNTLTKNSNDLSGSYLDPVFHIMPDDASITLSSPNVFSIEVTNAMY